MGCACVGTSVPAQQAPTDRRTHIYKTVHKTIQDKFKAGPPARRRLVAMLSAACVLYHKALKRAKYANSSSIK